MLGKLGKSSSGQKLIFQIAMLAEKPGSLIMMISPWKCISANLLKVS